MNKRITKKVVRNFTADVDGEPVHVNRRGCKGRWTKKDAEMLEELVRAVRRQYKPKSASSDAAGGVSP